MQIDQLMRDYGRFQVMGDAMLGAALSLFSGGSKDKVLKTQVSGKTLRLINKETDMLAEYLGFTKTKVKIKGKLVYKNGKLYIAQDLDLHIGGICKLIQKKGYLVE
ncbi:toxin C-terminal domain-containing protein [Paenibacillus odorifer]|uniref:toxin C-terminal domain-containing protein n=1 Tax=Paenibacillus odorifer TaxID=189426 RepID=UPI0015C3B0A0|nr:toxin C-terminal domain-containing protein [Paenibacillus odorifer]